MVREGPTLYAVCIPDLSLDEERPELFLDRYPSFLRLGGLYVPEALRRQGLARLMMRAAVNCAQKVKLPIYLDALPFAGRPADFPVLFRFYQSCGFRRFEGHPSAMVYEIPDEAHSPIDEPTPAAVGEPRGAAS